MIKVISIFGTRPEAIKMAPVVKALEAAGEVESQVLVSAQHREMLDQVLAHFDIVPDYDLDVMVERQSLEELTARVLRGTAGVLREARPDLVLVHGDTTTTLAASLAAFYQKIPVAHVEAGLRTGDKYSPFPEEVNRLLSDRLSDLHFAPTPWARSNLLKEGIPPEKIFVTGNTAIDALLGTVRPDYRFRVPGLPLESGRRHIVVEAHRRENWGEPMRAFCEGLRDVVRRHADVDVIYSVHRNPVVADVVRAILGDEERVYLFDPFDYPDWANLMARAYLLVTDSGGLQEEAPSLGVPVILLRRTTERPEAVEAGTVWRVDPGYETVVEALEVLLTDGERHRHMARASNPYGDGRASERIVEAILWNWGKMLAKPEEFRV